MKIAVLSGKGGTGKTLLAVNLANVIKDATYIDCDVEEPNGHLFFKPENTVTREVNILLPTQDKNKCIGCRRCTDFCTFNALAYINKKIMVFDEVCHSCEGCKLVCPTGAIQMRQKPIGTITTGWHNNVKVVTGELNIGEASGVPIIRELIDDADDNSVIDCPPGSACVVMESIKKADYCVLVSEPTIFGVSNLEMVYNLVKVFNKRFGVVLNKCTNGANLAEEFCNKHNIKVLGKIMWDNNLARISSQGNIASEFGYDKQFLDIYHNIQKEAQ